MTTPPLVGHIVGDAQQWLDQSSTAALQCRALRHSWPRETGNTTPGNKRIKWEPTELTRAGKWIEAERTMWCQGGCGTQRIETFRFTRGSMARIGRARYIYGDGYARRAAPGTVLEPLARDEVGYAILHRLYPGVTW